MIKKKSDVIDLIEYIKSSKKDAVGYSIERIDAREKGDYVGQIKRWSITYCNGKWYYAWTEGSSYIMPRQLTEQEVIHHCWHGRKAINNYKHERIRL